MKLKKHSNGYYYIHYDRRTTRSLKTKDKTLARLLFQDEKNKVRKGQITQLDKVKRLRLRDFRLEYMAERRQLMLIGEISEATYRNDDLALRRLQDAVGDIPIRSVAGQVNTFKAKMLAGAHDIEKRKNSINTYIRHLSSAFAWAATEDRAKDRPAYIDFNPFAETRTHKVKFKNIQKIPRAITLEDINTIRAQLKAEILALEAIDPDPGTREAQTVERALKFRRESALFFEVCLYTGMRPSEPAALNWSDINLNKGLIHVRKSKVNKERMVGMPSMLVEIIRGHGPRDIGKVFTYTSGTFSKQFKRLVRAAGLDEGIYLYRLKHSYTTLAVEAGVPTDVIQRNLGHASIKTTEIYLDALDDRQAEQVKDLDFGK